MTGLQNTPQTVWCITFLKSPLLTILPNQILQEGQHDTHHALSWGSLNTSYAAWISLNCSAASAALSRFLSVKIKDRNSLIRKVEDRLLKRVASIRNAINGCVQNEKKTTGEKQRKWLTVGHQDRLKVSTRVEISCSSLNLSVLLSTQSGYSQTENPE